MGSINTQRKSIFTAELRVAYLHVCVSYYYTMSVYNGLISTVWYKS